MALIGSRRALLKRRAAGGSGAATYADFEAWLDRPRPSTATVFNWNDYQGYSNRPAGSYLLLTAAASPSGNMFGSPWGFGGGGSPGLFSNFSPCRVIQHGLPSQAVFNEQIANLRRMALRVHSIGSEVYVEGVLRNGYQSGSTGDFENLFPVIAFDELAYWSEGKAWKINPYAMSAPVEFDPRP